MAPMLYLKLRYSHLYIFATSSPFHTSASGITTVYSQGPGLNMDKAFPYVFSRWIDIPQGFSSAHVTIVTVEMGRY